MVNALLQNPIIIMAAMAASYKSATATQGPTGLGAFTYLLIEKIYWYDPITAGDTVTIVDPITGALLLGCRCESAGISQVFDWTAKPKRWQDFVVNQISSGYLEIYTA